MRCRLLFDHQIFSMQKYGGISRYYFELLSRFARNKELVFDLPILFSDNYYLHQAGFGHFRRLLGFSSFKGKRRLQYVLNQYYSRVILGKGKHSLFHPTYYDPYFIKNRHAYPYVLTVYDMIHEKYAKEYYGGDPTQENKRRLIKAAAKIISISESTKKDLIEIAGVPEEKIVVTHLGPFKPLELTDVSFNLISKPYILYVGDRWGYKNFEMLAVSIADFLKKESVNLVCAGGGEFKKHELELLDRLGISRLVIWVKADDHTLFQLYKQALLFVFPSLYEGFGLPILEAFTAGCPVVVSQTSSFPEVAGKAAEYFNPNDRDSICSAIRKVAFDGTLRKKMICEGTMRVKEFTWERTADLTMKVYESVL